MKGLWLPSYKFGFCGYANMFFGLSSPTAKCHFKEMSQRKGMGKFGHFCIGALELFPILGGIASILEKLASKCLGSSENIASIDLSSKKIVKNEELKVHTTKRSAPKTFFEEVNELGDAILEFQNGSYSMFVKPHFSSSQAFSTLSQEKMREVEQVLDELISVFRGKAYTQKYGFLGSPPDYKRGDSIPAYFANASNGQSEWERVYLSLCGIRNMLTFGPEIIDDLIKTHFLDGVDHYASNKGIKKFFTYTGTTIDLYTTVSKRKFSHESEAILEAKRRIVLFGRQCGLKNIQGAEDVNTKIHPKVVAKEAKEQAEIFANDAGLMGIERQRVIEDAVAHAKMEASLAAKRLSEGARQVAHMLPKRNLTFDGYPHGEKIRNAYNDHTERGNCAIWQRNLHSEEYFINVPDIHIAIPAIIKLPYYVAEMALHDKGQNGGKFSQKFLNDFFGKAVSTKCFNEKFKTLIEYYSNWKILNFENSQDEVIEKKLKSDIKNGFYGERIRKMGFEKALQTLQTRNDIATLIIGTKKGREFVGGDPDLADFEPRPDESKDAWIQRTKSHFKSFLKEKGIYDSILYQKDKDSFYMRFNKKTFSEFLSDLYDYL